MFNDEKYNYYYFLLSVYYTWENEPSDVDSLNYNLQQYLKLMV